MSDSIVLNDVRRTILSEIHEKHLMNQVEVTIKLKSEGYTVVDLYFLIDHDYVKFLSRNGFVTMDVRISGKGITYLENLKIEAP